MLLEAVLLAVAVGTWPIHILCIMHRFVRIWTKMCQFTLQRILSSQSNSVKSVENRE